MDDLEPKNEVDPDAHLTLSQRRFLAAYRQTGNLRAAARASGVTRQMHYKLIGSCPEYTAAFEDAKEDAADLLVEEARRRAVEGTQEPVFFRGEECGKVLRYSDVLLMFLIKGVRPETYRENVKMEADVKSENRNTHQWELPEETLAAAAAEINRYLAEKSALATELANPKEQKLTDGDGESD